MKSQNFCTKNFNCSVNFFSLIVIIFLHPVLYFAWTVFDVKIILPNTVYLSSTIWIVAISSCLYMIELLDCVCRTKCQLEGKFFVTESHSCTFFRKDNKICSRSVWRNASYKTAYEFSILHMLLWQKYVVLIYHQL